MTPSSQELESPGNPGRFITVRTGNSLYHLIVLDPLGRKVLLQGGRYFPCTTEACLLEGSSVPELLLVKS